MATKTIDKYADFRYEIESETELDEAKWMISIGLYKDLDDYINAYTISEKRRMKRMDAEKKKLTIAKNRRKAA